MAITERNEEWKSGDVPTAGEFNRIESNIKDLDKTKANLNSPSDVY